MQAGHGFTESDERLKLANCVAVRGLAVATIHVCFAKFFVLVFEDLSGFTSELRLESATDFDVGLELLHCKVRVQSKVLESVHVDDVSSDMKVFCVIFFIEDYEKEVEAGHDWRRNVNIVAQ